MGTICSAIIILQNKFRKYLDMLYMLLQNHRFFTNIKNSYISYILDPSRAREHCPNLFHSVRLSTMNLTFF